MKLLLQLLEEGDSCGYQMIDELKRHGDKTFHLKAGKIYPMLHSLEEQGFVSAYKWEEGSKSRRYYRLTKDGEALLREMSEEPSTNKKG